MKGIEETKNQITKGEVVTTEWLLQTWKTSKNYIIVEIKNVGPQFLADVQSSIWSWNERRNVRTLYWADGGIWEKKYTKENREYFDNSDSDL